MADVESTCAELTDGLVSARKDATDQQKEVFKWAKKEEGKEKDKDKADKSPNSQRLIQDGVATQLRWSEAQAFANVQNTAHDFKLLMGTVEGRFSDISKGCASIVSKAKRPCGELPAVWFKYKKYLSEADDSLTVFQDWVGDATKGCKEAEGTFTDCVQRLNSGDLPMIEEVSLTRAWRVQNIVQPVVRSVQMGLVMTCLLMYLSHKSASRLLTIAVIASQAALFCLVIASLVRGCTTIALSFAILILASAHRYHKIMPMNKFVSVALECAAGSLEGTLGKMVWVAMLPALAMQAAVLLLSIGAALYLESSCGWPLIPALVLPLLAGVWTSEVMACVFRSAVGSAVSLSTTEGQGKGTAKSAVNSALGGPHGLGGIAAWAFFSALPFSCQSAVDAMDSIEMSLPQQGALHLGRSRGWLRHTAEGEGALGAASDKSFSEALRIIRLALALALSLVALGAPSGLSFLDTTVVAIAAIVVGHALAAVPVHALEASLWGFAAAVEEVGSERAVMSDELRDNLAKMVIKRPGCNSANDAC